MSENLKVSVSVFRIQHYKAFAEFAEHVERFVVDAKASGSRVLVLPEFLAMGLLWTSSDAAEIDNAKVSDFYRKIFSPMLPDFKNLMSSLAKKYDIYLVGGTFWHEEEGKGLNSAFVFKPDGSSLRQDKIHLTRGERAINSSGGDTLNSFEIDGVKCGLFVCYDVQYPELTQALVTEGIEVLFVPTLTEKRGAWRSWYSAHARALENQIYVCVSPLIGGLGIPNDYPVNGAGEAFIACPIDNRMNVEDGTYALSKFEEGEEGLIHADLNLVVLRLSRERGEVRHLKDRRPELYKALGGK